MIGSSCRWFAPLALSLAFAPGVARAQGVATSFEDVGQILKAGQKVLVVDAAGNRVEGRVVDVSAAALVVTPMIRKTGSVGGATSTGSTSIPATTISRIEWLPERRAWRKGLWIGPTAGFLLLIAAGEFTYPGVVLIGSLGAGIGAGIGGLIDASRPAHTLIYSATNTSKSLMVVPMAAPHQAGVGVTVRW